MISCSAVVGADRVIGPGSQVAGAVVAYLHELEGRHRSPLTLVAYRADLTQFIAWLEETNATAESVTDVARSDISEYLTYLGRLRCAGVSWQRKLTAIRGLFTHLAAEGLMAKSPTANLQTPKSAWKEPETLRPDEYARLLNLARHSSRDTAILSLLLRLGLRVSDLCRLQLGDLDLKAATLLVRAGKGQTDRRIDIDRKTVAALKAWLNDRPDVEHEQLFTSGHNLREQPLSVRGVRWLVGKYLDEASITKKASYHTLRHTCATRRYAKGADLVIIQRLLGHADLATTQLYLHPDRLDARKALEATNL